MLIWHGVRQILRLYGHSQRIEVNPDQIKAINNLRSPRNPKEVQKLTEMAVALNRFISRSADRCKPFFLLINK